MMISSLRTRSRQTGASLLVSLVFLVIMAMLGVTVANVTSLQERMAGHTRDRDLALQAAEASLRDAEERLADSTFRAAATVFNELNGNDAAFWEACFTAATPADPCLVTYTPTHALPLTGPGAVAEQPQYVLELKTGTPDIYRVTARGVGGTAEAIVILQAEFAYVPPAP
jgi:type IV pilus assembly protein PilX